MAYTKESIADMAGAIAALTRRVGRTVRLMEVCGTHTVALFRHGIRSLLPPEVVLLSGPGCPVCVTSVRDVETAIACALRPETVLVTFGDMMRVPGALGSLQTARAEGADVRIVYCPLDALEIAEREPGRTVVFFATGFETTSPLVAATLQEARRRGIGNLAIHPVHKLVPPALKALLDAGETAIDGFILPGHVSTVIGSAPYGFLASDYGVPGVVTGFDAGDIVEGVLMLMQMLVARRPAVEIQYRSVVRPGGNPRAVAAIKEVFEPAEAQWRGIGLIPASGLALRPAYADFALAGRFPLEVREGSEPRGCACGEVLRGIRTPPECPLFGKRCTPESPVGACMVSTEGSCAAYYRYGERPGGR